LGALERVTLPGDRRDYYRIAEDVHDRMLEIRLARFRSTRQLLTAAKRTLAARDAKVSERVKQFSSFFSHMEDAIRQTRTKWERDAKRARGGAQRKSRS
jgi:hypothetical protein